MVKKIVVILFFSFVMISNVYAEPYYENDYGVQLTEEEYNFVTELYDDEYPSRMTQTEYNNLKDNNMFGQEIKHVGNDEDVVTYGFFETPYKKLTANYVCGTKCTVVAHLNWKKVPATKSYDLFGTYYENIGDINGITALMHVNGTASTPTEYKANSTGVAATHLLPSTIDASTVFSFDFSYTVDNRGSAWVSYQHAQKSLSLANSRRYSFSYNGYGNVFAFQEAIRPYYDQMTGIEITFE